MTGRLGSCGLCKFALQGGDGGGVLEVDSRTWELRLRVWILRARKGRLR